VNGAFTSFGGWRESARPAKERCMDGNRNSGAQGGGAIIAGSIIAGVVAGVVLGQPSIGFLAGTGIGIAIALLLYWKQRKT
jgi:hypothetical protein